MKLNDVAGDDACLDWTEFYSLQANDNAPPDTPRQSGPAGNPISAEATAVPENPDQMGARPGPV